MDKFIDLFKSKNMRVTQQRLEIYKMLSAGSRHLTAENIYENIRQRIPAVSLATIYTILDFFKEKGLVSEIRIRFNKSCFESRTDLHHHFLCRECENIFDIDIKPCLALERKEIKGHLLEELQGYFYGICKTCRGK